jgi:hypothetical protein
LENTLVFEPKQAGVKSLFWAVGVTLDSLLNHTHPLFLICKMNWNTFLISLW